MRWLWIVCICLFSSCALQRVYPIPPWIFQIPKSDRYVYVVGSAGYSISSWESKEMAIQDALIKLAQYVGTDVAIRAIRGKEGSRTWGSAKYIQTVTEASLQNVELVAFWADPKGKAGLGYRVFVLLRMKKSQK